MARFVLQAVPASFIRSGALVLCSVPMRAVPLIRRDVEARTEAEAVAHMGEARRQLDSARVPYSLTLRLADARAPRGFKAWAHGSTRVDESFGSEA